MRKKKLKIKEGDVFAVPLLQGGYVIGLVAREHKEITLGYFFKTIFSAVPEELDTTDINRWPVAMIGKFSTLGIEEGEWPLLKTNIVFKREDWPIPVLKMQDPLTEQYFAVLYDDTLVNEERYKITKEEADQLFGHGNFGYGALQKKISSILADSKDN
jgi:hypothetical protein